MYNCKIIYKENLYFFSTYTPLKSSTLFLKNCEKIKNCSYQALRPVHHVAMESNSSWANAVSFKCWSALTNKGKLKNSAKIKNTSTRLSALRRGQLSNGPKEIKWQILDENSPSSTYEGEIWYLCTLVENVYVRVPMHLWPQVEHERQTIRKTVRTFGEKGMLLHGLEK